MRFIFTAIIYLSAASYIIPQIDTNFISKDFIDQLLEDSSIEEEDSELYDLIEYYYNNPVNINSADYNSLSAVPFLNEVTAEAIINYRNQNQKFFSVSELKLIEEIDNQLFQKIRLFVSVKKREIMVKEQPKSFYSEIDLEIRNRVISNLQNAKGYIDKNYSGNKLKSYNRLKAGYKNYKAGILIEKDAGEMSYTDYVSAHISIENFSIFRKIILGDYLVEFGQGLAMWSPYSFSKGSDAVGTINKRNRGIIQYTSADENNFLRGAAVKFEFENLTLTTFLSKNEVDANIDPVSNVITSLPVTGYHRTINEINNKNRLTLNTFGASADFHPLQNISLSLLTIQNNFSSEFPDDSPFDLSGNEFRQYSFAYTFFIDKVSLTGETSFNSVSVANLHNLKLFINDNLTFVTSVRNYPRNFFTVFANGFGESNNTQNEFGFYSGLQLKINPLRINIYYDHFKFPFASYLNPLPASGNEFMTNIEYKLNRDIFFTFRYQNETKEISYVTASEELITKRLTNKYRIEMKNRAANNLFLKTRIEYHTFELDELNNFEDGFLIYQDIKTIPFDNLSAYFRFVIFNTQSYNTRIYEFENDLYGMMSNTALFGEGYRWYLLIKYKVFNMLTFSIKYSETIKPAEESFGSGNSEKFTDHDNYLNLQFDLKF
ncbi:MAG: helix-hairpin-helix domain-containing protein [Melioribacteraceae bacterium]|nr:helix-hairpin-helix domain-containing protein [Melioribacteraceae bacterium]MCF8353416.1 helix-hairpin-helix domain-containing protein [Melioribacteraceae bacterium]MCF8396489.1 helix-hairpin-helix domain-containing protein [Melioribacteraceae bacterium]MCF8418977.1 helix-hairpin-helix domain-containing protein [Melioribacteraceae bacterium]